MDHEHDRKHDEGQLERLTFFSDAVFAIAMTLLVIEVRLPPVAHGSDQALAQALADLLPKFFAFVLSFLVIGRFWLAHHRVFGLLAGTSDRLLWINLFVLMLVAFMPFPTSLISEHGSQRIAVMAYAGSLLVLGIAQRLLVVTALGRNGLARADVPQAERDYLLRGSWIPAVIGTASVIASAFSGTLGMAVLVLGSPVVFRVLHRRGRSIAAS